MISIEESFRNVTDQGRQAIMPFITAGDPDLSFTADLLLQLDALKPGLFEIGFPYSDPIADGPVIQESYVRALEANVSVDAIFDMMHSINGKMTQARVAMVSYAIVMRYGVDRFIDRAAEAGFSGLIVPDFPWDPEDDFVLASKKSGLDVVPLVTPTTPPQRAKMIAKRATGFVYYVSVAGVTGVRIELPPQLGEDVDRLRGIADVPVCIGFGVSGPQQVRQLAPMCDGLIVGSAIVRRIASASGGKAVAKQSAIANVVEFVRDLIANTGTEV